MTFSAAIGDRLQHAYIYGVMGTMADFDLKDHFHYGMWAGGGAETVSGAGSTARYTERLRPALHQLISSLNVKTLLDAPCGDFNWMQYLDLSGVQYIGVDIVEQVVAENKERFARPGVDFRVSDITKDPLPSATLMLCRDVILHLPYMAIADLFENISKSEIDYILISSHVVPINRDLAVPGAARLVNLTAAPFDFPRPKPSNCIPDWVRGYPERYLLLYTHDEFTRAARTAIPRLRSSLNQSETPAGTSVLAIEPRHLPTESDLKRLARQPIVHAGQQYPVSDRPNDEQAFRLAAPSRVMEYEGICDNPNLLHRTLQ